MILKSLYLKFGELNHPDNRHQFPIEYSYGFLRRSRCLCNYLEREVLRPLRFRCEGFDRIVVSLVFLPSDRVFVNSCKVIEVEVKLDQLDYESRQGDELMEYFIHRLTAGFVKCAKSATIPVEELLSGIQKICIQWNG